MPTPAAGSMRAEPAVPLSRLSRVELAHEWVRVLKSGDDRGPCMREFLRRWWDDQELKAEFGGPLELPPLWGPTQLSLSDRDTCGVVWWQ